MKSQMNRRFVIQDIFIILLIVWGLQASALFGDNAVFPERDRIVVVGDIHGDYERMMEAFQLGEVVDNKGRWIGKKTHLVQLGDIPDRGPDSLKIVEYLKKLEKSARRKGGRVHVLIGNHDAMNVYGDLRYVSSGEYEAFKEKQSTKRLEALYEDEAKWIKENVPEENWPVFDEAHREEWFKKHPPGFLEHRWAWLPDGEIGQWVLSHNSVLKVGPYLFVHAGIGPAWAGHSIEELNQLVTDSLQDLANVESSILRSQEGPLWYRGLAQHPEDTEIQLVDALLQKHDVDHIIVGHTVTGGVILPRFDGKVIMADVGLSSYYGDFVACLVLEGNSMTAVHSDGRVPLPESTRKPDMEKYFKEVLKLEPDNEHLQQRMNKLSKAEAIRELVP